MTDLAWRKNMKAGWQIIKVVVLSGGWILLGLSAWHFKERIFSRADSLFSADAENVRWKQLVDTRKTDLRSTEDNLRDGY